MYSFWQEISQIFLVQFLLLFFIGQMKKLWFCVGVWFAHYIIIIVASFLASIPEESSSAPCRNQGYNWRCHLICWNKLWSEAGKHWRKAWCFRESLGGQEWGIRTGTFYWGLSIRLVKHGFTTLIYMGLMGLKVLGHHSWFQAKSTFKLIQYSEYISSWTTFTGLKSFLALSPEFQH